MDFIFTFCLDCLKGIRVFLWISVKKHTYTNLPDFTVPSRYVHSQTDHMTFRPTPYVHPIFCPLTIFYCDTSTMWHFSTVIFRLCDIPTLWRFSTATLRPCDNFLLWHFDHVTFFYCDIPTLWQFSTVTFHLKVDGLSVHTKKWMVCHTVTFQPTVILANPWLWHIVHFRF